MRFSIVFLAVASLAGVMATETTGSTAVSTSSTPTTVSASSLVFDSTGTGAPHPFPSNGTSGNGTVNGTSTHTPTAVPDAGSILTPAALFVAGVAAIVGGAVF
ncbi:hypothetical protein DFH27DRAFT_307650 [Peziza echinospora]|nr:hypothetical protein DFH27DRAFT_307650 [Peziza echinospora]